MIPIGADGSLSDDLVICDSESEAMLAATQRHDRRADLVIAEELELIRVIGRVRSDMLASLVV